MKSTVDITVDRRRQREAMAAHASQAVASSIVWRRLELLGDKEYLQQLRPASGAAGAAVRRPRERAELCPAGTHSRQRHRRRRGRRNALWAAARDLRRLHRLGPRPHLHRGLRPVRGAPALREHPHRELRNRPADELGCARTPGRSFGDAVGGDDETLVIFTGSGATGAIDKLIAILNLRIPNDLDAAYHLSSQIPPDERPVVFIGPFEHHSNELPWRESIADVVVIPEDETGHLDVERLDQ